MATSWVNFLFDFLEILGKLADNTWNWLLSDITFDGETVKMWQLLAVGGLAVFVLGKAVIKALSVL